MNASAGVVSCSRGKLDPKELEGLGAFDRLMRCIQSRVALPLLLLSTVPLTVPRCFAVAVVVDSLVVVFVVVAVVSCAVLFSILFKVSSPCDHGN